MGALRECGLAETSEERNGKATSRVKPHHVAPSWSDNNRPESILGASVPLDLLRLYPSPKSIVAIRRCHNFAPSVRPSKGILRWDGDASSPMNAATYCRELRNVEIASRSCFSSWSHFQRGACSDSSERVTMGSNSGGASCHSQMCIRMCVSSLNTFDSPDSARRAASAARARRAWFLEGEPLLPSLGRPSQSRLANVAGDRIYQPCQSSQETAIKPVLQRIG